MKAESNLKPSAAFEIETHGATATVILYDNVTKTTRRTDSGEETSYTFDRYTVETTTRENLAEIVGANTTSWLEYAKQAEYDRLAATVRAERDQLLAASDKEFALDRLGLDCSSPEMLLAALAGKINGEMAEYRQALRDITAQPGFPYTVEFPKKPSRK